MSRGSRRHPAKRGDAERGGRGHAQVPPAVLQQVDSLLIADQLATLRAVAEAAGVSRDTVQRRRRELEAAGQIIRLTVAELRTARNRSRFEKVGPLPGPRRSRVHDASFRLELRSADGDEIVWDSGVLTFRGPVPIDERRADELMQLFVKHVRDMVQNRWPEINHALAAIRAGRSGKGESG